MPHPVQSEEVEELVCAHALKARVLLANDRVGDAHLEFLQTHYLLLQRASCDQSVHVHNPFLRRNKTMLSGSSGRARPPRVRFISLRFASLVSDKSSNAIPSEAVGGHI